MRAFAEAFKNMRWYAVSVKYTLFVLWAYTVSSIVYYFLISNNYIYQLFDIQSPVFKVALIILSAIGVISLVSGIIFFSDVDNMIKSSSSSDVHSIVAPMLQKAGIDPGKVIVLDYDDNAPRAFALSFPFGGRSMIMFSKGLINIMPATSDEFKAVAAHEIAHIISGDSVSKTYIKILHIAIYSLPMLFGEIIKDNLKLFYILLMVVIAVSSLGYFLTPDFQVNQVIPLFKIVLLPIMIFYLIKIIGLVLNIIEQTYSKQREFIADKYGAMQVSPKAMIDALKCVSSNDTQTATSFIHSLLDSHPPIDVRIRRLSSIVPVPQAP